MYKCTNTCKLFPQYLFFYYNLFYPGYHCLHNIGPSSVFPFGVGGATGFERLESNVGSARLACAGILIFLLLVFSFIFNCCGKCSVLANLDKVHLEISVIPLHWLEALFNKRLYNNKLQSSIQSEIKISVSVRQRTVITLYQDLLIQSLFLNNWRRRI